MGRSSKSSAAIGRCWDPSVTQSGRNRPRRPIPSKARSTSLSNRIFKGSLGLEKDVGKLQLRLTGNVEREAFGDAELSTGGTVSQEDRNSTLVTGVLRTGYEISPALALFVDLEYGHRFYDLDVDSNGFDRAADHVGARGGLGIRPWREVRRRVLCRLGQRGSRRRPPGLRAGAQRQRRPRVVTGSRHDRRPEGTDDGGGLDRRQ